MTLNERRRIQRKIEDYASLILETGSIPLVGSRELVDVLGQTPVVNVIAASLKVRHCVDDECGAAREDLREALYEAQELIYA